MNVFAQHGWLCPHCHKAHAPSVLTCPYELQTYTSTGTGKACSACGGWMTYNVSDQQWRCFNAGCIGNGVVP